MNPFGVFFWIRVVFSYVIHSSMFASCWHLLRCWASLSWMDVNFYNLDPCKLSWSGVFQLDIFLSVTRHKFASEPSLSSSNSFSIRHSYYVLSVSKIALFLLHPVVDLSEFSFHQYVGRNFFRYLGKSCLVYIAWPSSGTFWVPFISPMI